MFAVLHHRRATSTPIFLSQSSIQSSNHPIIHPIIQSQSSNHARRGVRAAAGRARRVVDIEGRPDDPRRRAAEKNGRHPRHGWRAHDRSFAPSRRRRPKDGASAAANARVRERRRSGSSDDPEARNKSRRPRARRLPRSKQFRPRVVRRGTGGARERARRAPRSARASCRWAAAPRAHFSEAHIAAPAHGTGPSQCCPRSPARRSGRSSAGTRPREGFIEPRARVPRPRMRLPSVLFGVGSVRERETGVVAACCLESPNPHLAASIELHKQQKEHLLKSRRRRSCARTR